MIFLLLSNAVSIRKDKSILYSRLVLSVIFISALIIFNDLSFNNLSKYIGMYGGLYHVSCLTHMFHLFILILSFIIMFLTSFYHRKILNHYCLSFFKLFIYRIIYANKKILNKTSKQFRISEYPLLILFILIGILLVISTSDLISMFLSIELQSYGFYIICTIYRNSELSTSGGLTYFLLGGLSSCLILLGSSMLYVNSGTTYTEGLYIITSVSDLTHNAPCWYKPYYLHISMLIISTGFLFKLSASPFHFWSPDVYDAIPTLITTVVAILSKISIFILLFQIANFTCKYPFTYDYNWIIIISTSSLLSLIVGTVGGLTQSKIKRLYAYSTISHTGFILLAICINSIESIQSFIFYVIQYSISNLNAFIILLTMGYIHFFSFNKENSYKHIPEVNNSPIQYIEQIKGYFYINPFLSLSLVITLFSFIGLPPLMGFFGKLMVLTAAIDKGYIYLSLVGILTSVISAVYYLNIVKIIFFTTPNIYNLKISDMNLFAYIIKNNVLINKILIKKITISSNLTITISILTLIILFFIIVPQELLDMTNILSLCIFN